MVWHPVDNIAVGPTGAEVSSANFGVPVRDNLGDLDTRANALRADLGTWDGGGTAVSRIGTLETNQGTRGTYLPIYSEVANLWTRASEEDGRLDTLEARTTHASTGNTALGDRVTTLETAKPYVRYRSVTQGTAQTLPSGVDVQIQFPDIVTSHSAVTALGTNNNQFTINEAGVWIVEAGWRAGGATNAEIRIILGTGTWPALAGTLGNGFGSTGAACLVQRRFAAGDVIRVGGWHNAGTTRTIDYSFGDATHITFSRLSA